MAEARVAATQMRCGQDCGANIHQAERLARQAAGRRLFCCKTCSRLRISALK
jgi:predicted amidohydrolase